MSNTEISDKELSYLVDLIKKWETLPAKYKETLFWKEIEKKEYELKYGWKDREEDIISETYACPLQKVRTFEPDKIINHDNYIREPDTKKEFYNGWYNKLIFWDNLQVLKTLLTDDLLKKQIKENGWIKLIYIDPPFATKSDFTSWKWEKAYTDKIAWAEFIEFIRKRLVLMRELLAEDGSIYVHLDQKKAHYIKIIMDEVFWEEHARSSITWDTSIPYVAGNKRLSNNWIYSQANIFYYTKSTKNFIFNKESIEIKQPSWDISKKPVKNIWADIKNFAGFLGAKDDKMNYPTQKPEALLERIIKASSNEWDIIFDAFSGSWTTIAVAEKLWRRRIGIDCGKLAIYTIQSRLMNLKKEIGSKKWEPLVPAPFAVYNAWLYDFKILSNLDWDTYKWFVLKLFQATQEEIKLNNFVVDGKLWLNYAHVFDFNHGIEWKTLDYGYIHHIDEMIWNKIGKKFYIIAPATKVDFLETTVHYNWREYIILRVPYSIINELHKKDFEKIVQPRSEMDVNNTVEAVWFDFIRSPKVEVEYSLEGDKAIIELKTFQSKVISNKKVKYGNLETLSCVIIDYEYNWDYLHFEEVIFSDKIRKDDYKISLDKTRLKDNCMIVYIDIFWNEKREIIHLDTFNK